MINEWGVNAARSTLSLDDAIVRQRPSSSAPASEEEKALPLQHARHPSTGDPAISQRQQDPQLFVAPAPPRSATPSISLGPSAGSPTINRGKNLRPHILKTKPDAKIGCSIKRRFAGLSDRLKTSRRGPCGHGDQEASTNFRANHRFPCHLQGPPDVFSLPRRRNSPRSNPQSTISDGTRPLHDESPSRSLCS